ncbi:condensation domain-containing protein [Streptomyces sp. ET3-23]|uniref:condensation domain-containing protein n=1 Tax=Streptomyces sp. ET3-23 TaxID=2885643 RepID=UPI001D12FF8C|nr:condensation domain-containing protein [Streptomyces sp. ET3-23]MCC2274805.1 condensation domain-containing protein [Streptomyces sp. ET3-23]
MTPTPASAAEQTFWFTEQLLPGSLSTVALLHLRIDGPADPDALAAAWQAVRTRHEALRTAFVSDGGELWRQPVTQPRPVPVQVLPAGTAREDAVRLLCAAPYDLETADVLRLGLVPDALETPYTGAELYAAVHHTAYDGLSEVALGADLAEAYRQALAGQRPHLAPAARSAVRPLDGARRQELCAYWERALAGVPALPEQQPAQTHREILQDRLAVRPLPLAPGTGTRLRQVARRSAVPPFALLLTAVGRAVAELTGAADFLVGVPFSTRTPDQQDEVGCELTMLPVRLRDPSSADGPDRAMDALLDAMYHADLPVYDILACSTPDDTGRMQPYQVIAAYQSWPRDPLQAGPAVLRARPSSPCGPQGELLVEFYDEGPDDLTAALYVPAHGGWLPRAPELAAALDRHLTALTPMETS